MTTSVYNRNSHPAQEGNSATDDTHSGNGIESELVSLSSELNAIHAAIEECRTREKELKPRFQKTALKLSWIGDRKERLRIARELYWKTTDVHAYVIAAALLMDRIDLDIDLAELNLKMRPYHHRIRMMIGPIGYVRCSTIGCDGKAPISSRAAYERYRKGESRRSYCEDCIERQREESKHLSHEQEQLAAELAAERAAEDAEFARLEAQVNLSDEEKVMLYTYAANRMWREVAL